MAKYFNEVITAIAKSVAEAESHLEETQLSYLSKYFKKKKNKSDKDNIQNGKEEYLPGIFPIRLKIGMPDENSKYGNKYYCVPYINLIPISQLNIDSVTASFDIGVLELIEPSEKKNNSVFNEVYKDDRLNNMKNFKNSSNISVNVTGAGIDKDKGTIIKINISITKTETSEGMSKLINEITNSSQGFIKVKNGKNYIDDQD